MEVVADRSHPARPVSARRAAGLALTLAVGLAAAAAGLVAVEDLLTAVWGGIALTLAGSMRSLGDTEPSESDDEG